MIKLVPSGFPSVLFLALTLTVITIIDGNQTPIAMGKEKNFAKHPKTSSNVALDTNHHEIVLNQLLNTQSKTNRGNHNLPLMDSDGPQIKTGHNMLQESSRPPKAWKCSTCICLRIYYSNHDTATKVNCTGRRLTSIPEDLPSDVTYLNMSFNIMSDFDTSTVLKYRTLRNLDLRHNRVHSIRGNINQTARNLQSLVTLNLYNNIIDSIQDSALAVFTCVKRLQLSYNRLITITNGTFIGLRNLQDLDLSKNRIRYIDDESFDHLESLYSLFLNQNHELSYAPRHLKPRIFQNLLNVRKFRIQGSAAGYGYYPNDVLAHMPNLKELNIDGIESQLFSQPKISLRKLTFGPHAVCNFKNNITSDLFKNVPNLTSLEFSYCNFHGIDPDALSYIPLLESLSLIHVTSYDLDYAFEGLQTLQNYSLKYLKFVHLFHWANCKILSYQQGKYIENLPLERLVLIDNRISLLRNDFLQTIPRSLKTLDISMNKILEAASLWLHIPFLINLLELKISKQNIAVSSHFPTKVSYFDSLAKWDSMYNDSMLKSRPLTKLHGYRPNMFNFNTHELIPENEIDAFSLEENTHSGDWIDEISHPENDDEEDDESVDILSLVYNEMGRPVCKHIPSSLESKKHTEEIPPNLKVVFASLCMGFGDYLLNHAVRWSIKNRLTKLYFPETFMSSWGSGVLPCHVKEADFSYNQCDTISAGFFPVNNSIIKLNIKNNYLGIAISQDLEGNIFSQATKLTHLDISSNNIFLIPDNFFRGVPNLNKLHLAENKIRVLNIRFSHLSSLKYMDVSKNSIHFITKETMDGMNRIAEDHTFIVDFSDNSFPCTCDGLPIISWLATTGVALQNMPFLTCIDSKGNIELIGDIFLRWKTLQRECGSKFNLLIVGVILGVVFLLLLIVGLLYQNIWKLRYWKNRLLSQWLGFRPKAPRGSNFKFDAYIVYDQEDRLFIFDHILQRLEKVRGHKLCVEDRDFIPGTFITNNITCAIQNSTVTLLIVSPSAISSPEVEYIIQMALMEEIYSENKRQVLHLIMYHDPGETPLSTNYLSLLRNDRFVRYPPVYTDGIDENVMEMFWDDLSNVIGHTSDTDTSPNLELGSI